MIAQSLSTRVPQALAVAVPLAFLGLLFGWPVVAMRRLGFADGGVLDVLRDDGTWDLVVFTLGQAAASTVLTVLAGLPVAWLLARAELPGRWLLRVAVTVPFVLPTVVIGVAFRSLVGEGLLPILLAHAFFNTAVVARTVGGLWAHTDRRAEDVARALGAPPWRAALTSLRTATDATVIALIVGVLAAAVLARSGRGRGAEALDAALMLPLGVSAVTVGFGYLVTLGPLRSSPLLVPLVQALIAVPLVVRTVLPVLRAVDVRLRQAAATLGASPWRVWREVDLPLAGRAVLAAAGFAYVIALGEFGATSFLARSEPTLPVAVALLIGRPGELNTQLAYAACALLVVVTVAVVALVERVRIAEVGEF